MLLSLPSVVLGAKRLGAKRLGGETTWGESTWGRNDLYSFKLSSIAIRLKYDFHCYEYDKLNRRLVVR
jgi:hypothetical protein